MCEKKKERERKTTNACSVLNLDGHFVIYVMKLQSLLMINAPAEYRSFAITRNSDRDYRVI